METLLNELASGIGPRTNNEDGEVRWAADAPADFAQLGDCCLGPLEGGMNIQKLSRRYLGVAAGRYLHDQSATFPECRLFDNAARMTSRNEFGAPPGQSFDVAREDVEVAVHERPLDFGHCLDDERRETSLRQAGTDLVLGDYGVAIYHGRATSNLVPDSAVEVIPISPPCAMTMARVMNKP